VALGLLKHAAPLLSVNKVVRIALLSFFFLPSLARAGGVLFIDRYPEEYGVQVRSFSIVTRNSGKVRFTDKNGRSETIEERSVPGIIIYYDESEFPNIMDEISLEPIIQRKLAIQSLGLKLEDAKPFAHKAVAAYDGVIARFRLGDRKVNGKWRTATEVHGQEVAAQTTREQKIAEARAAEKKQFTAEQSAQEERLQTLRKGQDAVEKEFERVQERVRTDIATAQRTLAAAHEQLQSGFKSAEKGALVGQVFVRTEDANNIKLSTVRLQLYARDSLDILIQMLDHVRDNFAEDHRGVEDQLNQMRQTVRGERAAIDERLNGIRDAFDIDRAKYSEMLRAYGSKLDGIEDDLDAIAGKLNDMSSYFLTADFYFSVIKKPIMIAETDPDGRFTMEVPKRGNFVVAAQAERATGAINQFTIQTSRTSSRKSVSQTAIRGASKAERAGETTSAYAARVDRSIEQESGLTVGHSRWVFTKKEQYYWLQPVSLDGSKALTQNFSNNNLTTAENTSSLIRTAVGPNQEIVHD
jgi:hypothetical protein